MSIKKSKSLNSLKINDVLIERDCCRTVSESSIELYILNDTLDSDDVVEDTNKMADSRIEDKKLSDSDMLLCMEQKIDRLSGK